MAEGALLENSDYMADQLQKMVADKKDMVETIMEVFEQGAEVVASIAGDIFPVFAIAAPIVKLALDNVESKEAAYMKEQFQKVRDRLEVVSEQVKRINDEIKKSGVDATYFSVEENITNQFRKYMDILKAKPKFREVKKNLFLEHFEKTGGDKNLHTLYNAVMGNNFTGESVLEIIMNYEEKSRRAMEVFCARLKHLFCVGLIALLGHAALNGYGEEEDLLKAWSEKMQTVQKRMDAVIEDCIVSFPKLAEQDSRRIVRLLVKKKDFHCPTGKSRFQVPSSEERLNVVVSYSSSPEPVDRERVSQIVLGQKKLSAVPTAELLFRELPGDCVVHTIKPKSWPAAPASALSCTTGRSMRRCLCVCTLPEKIKKWWPGESEQEAVRGELAAGGGVFYTRSSAGQVTTPKSLPWLDKSQFLHTKMFFQEDAQINPVLRPPESVLRCAISLCDPKPCPQTSGVSPEVCDLTVPVLRPPESVLRCAISLCDPKPRPQTSGVSPEVSISLCDPKPCPQTSDPDLRPPGVSPEVCDLTVWPKALSSDLRSQS
ncbi:hypothetical protein WMY93_032850 [Mugilogobius chulae]|uniref:Rapunzel 4 n=1 Tax=Mugilogobius chulae TaxID=88201 RepID=A0AAW0MVL5_9GOBI